MNNNRRTQIFTIIALTVALMGLGVGFAAFSNTLKISSNLKVTPDPNDFKVVFYPADKDGNKITGTTELTAHTVGTAKLNKDENGNEIKATINGTTIENIDIIFENPGDVVNYYGLIENEGEYNAYLHNIFFIDPENSEDKNFTRTCVGIPNERNELPDQAMLDAACASLQLSFIHGINTDNLNIFTKTTPSIENNYIPPKQNSFFQFYIGYPDGSPRVDGSFKVEFGDIELDYKTTSNIK